MAISQIASTLFAGLLLTIVLVKLTHGNLMRYSINYKPREENKVLIHFNRSLGSLFTALIFLLLTVTFEIIGLNEAALVSFLFGSGAILLFLILLLRFLTFKPEYNIK